MGKDQHLDEETIEEGFSRVSSKYSNEEDSTVIDANRRAYDEAANIAILLEGSSGEQLIKWLDAEITTCILQLLNTREARYLSDLQSLYELRKKLTNAKSVKSTIEDWLMKH